MLHPSLCLPLRSLRHLLNRIGVATANDIPLTSPSLHASVIRPQLPHPSPTPTTHSVSPLSPRLLPLKHLPIFVLPPQPSLRLPQLVSRTQPLPVLALSV